MAASSAASLGLPRITARKAGMDLEPLDRQLAGLRAQVDAGKMPGFACAVVKDANLVHLSTYGFADVEGKVPMRPDTLFRLYSQTKPITIVGFMRLWERGLVDLSDAIAKYIPAFADVQVLEDGDCRPPHRPPNVRDLLAQTSGVGFGPGFGYEPENDYEVGYYPLVQNVDAQKVSSLAAWCNELAKLPLRFQPGADWGYGYSSDVLGRIIEVISGKPLDKFLHEEVLDPLGMVDTGFSVPASKASRLASLTKREPWDGSGRKVEFITIDAGGSGKPNASQFLEGNSSPVIQGGGCVCSLQGGLVSCLRDYARFGIMLLNKGTFEDVRLLKPETVELLAGDWINDCGAAPRASPIWVWDNPGMGFSPFGQVGVPAKDAPRRRGAGNQLSTVHWGGAGGSSYMFSWPHQLMTLTYTGCIYDTSTQSRIWSAAFSALLPSAGKRRRVGANVIVTMKKQPRARNTMGKRSHGQASNRRVASSAVKTMKIVLKRPAKKSVAVAPRVKAKKMR